jgi:aspartyl-tRNA(Asn)/glutamyl-tRNA(Gln) amidotransferase subunit C
MAVGNDEVRRIAALARLRLEDEDVDRLTGELNRILEHVRSLDEADTSGAGAPVRLPDEPVPFRDPVLGPDELEAGAPGDRAPDWRDGFFVVPRLPALEAEDGEGEARE